MELIVKIEPLDFVLAPVVLGKFLRVIEPMMTRKPAGGASAGVPLDQFTTSDLPLIYLDIQQVRAFVPTVGVSSDRQNQPDTIVIHVRTYKDPLSVRVELLTTRRWFFIMDRSALTLKSHVLMSTAIFILD